VLRGVGLPVSMAEMVDAADAVAHLDVTDRARLRRVLALTMVKRYDQMTLFHGAFDFCFPASGGGELVPESPSGQPGSESPALSGAGIDSAGSPVQADLMAELVAALRSGSADALRRLGVQAVDAFGGLDGASPRGTRYHYYRIVRQLDLSALLHRAMRLDDAAEPTQWERWLAGLEGDARLERLRTDIAAEVQRRLAEAGGLEDAIRQLQRSVLDIDFLRAGPAELERMRHALRPLARRMAARARRRHRLRRIGRLDARRTFRSAVNSGGVPLHPAWRRRRPTAPHLLVLCDVSGSVADFARFTLSLLQALHGEFARIRSFVFVDGPAEVTDLMRSSPGVIDARLFMSRPGAVRGDGHSDYGAAFRRFLTEYGRGIVPQSTVVICGDARGNYHPASPELLMRFRRSVHRIYWLNPEPAELWGTKDSAATAYAKHCDDMTEIRNLRQLETWVERLLR
jgi:uncharacterized protein with von Willebrand factor type A (vWA) domain